MIPLISVALWCAASGQIPLATETELPGGQRVELFADKLEMLESAQLKAHGHAVMRAEGTVLRADELVYDSKAQRATAKGNVMLALTTGGLYAAVADSVTVKLTGGQVSEVFVDSGLIMQKQKVTAEQLLAAATPAELRDLGESTVTLTGTHLKRVGPNEWAVEKLSFTPCDCDPKEPSWRVEASNAVIDLEDKHATLTFPTVYVKSVPIFWLPWIYLPLSDRRTGLLVPRPSNTSLNGWALDVPVFVTLGESYDVTLMPGYFFGADPPEGKVKEYGVKGPRLLTEFRYAPSVGTSGNLTVGLLDDHYPQRDPVSPGYKFEETPPPRGLRGEASLRHSQALGKNWFDRVDASVVSDGYYVRDLTPSVLSREQEYMRSTGSVFHRGDDHYAGLEVALRQDLNWGYSLLKTDPHPRELYSPRGPSTFQKLPEVVLDVPLKRLLGPVQGSFRAAFTRHAPLRGSTGDEGISANEGRSIGTEGPLPTACLSERLFYPAVALNKDGVPVVATRRAPYCGELPPVKVGQGDGFWQEGEREPRDRIDLAPRVSASVGGPAARLTPYLGYREDLYLGERTGRTSHRGYPLGGAVVESELSRTFGDEASVRHAIRPIAELRYVPHLFGTAPAPYDDVDVAVPEAVAERPPAERRLLQLVAEVRQTLARRTGASVVEAARLDVGQGFDLLPLPDGSRTAETFGRLTLARAPLNLSALARYDSVRRRLTQVELALGLVSPKGDALTFGYESLFVQGSDRTRAGIDTLFGPGPIDLEPINDHAERFTADAQTRFKFGLGLHYLALFLRQKDVNADPVAGVTPATSLWLAEQQLGVSYGPACDCWRIEVHATQRPRWPRKSEDTSGIRDYAVFPDFGVTLTISRFGTFGTGN